MPSVAGPAWTCRPKASLGGSASSLGLKCWCRRDLSQAGCRRSGHGVTVARGLGMAGGNAMAGEPSLLVVDDLRVVFPGRDGGRVEAVRGISFALGRERLGIVGESGSGKSQAGRAIMGLSPRLARVTASALPSTASISWPVRRGSGGPCAAAASP